MINESKKRDASPLAHLGPSGINRRVVAVLDCHEITKRTNEIQKIGRFGEDMKKLNEDLATTRRRFGHAPLKRGKGRPKATAPKPWEAEGITRATWYRRQKEKRVPHD
jgi:hypothetical protein